MALPISHEQKFLIRFDEQKFLISSEKRIIEGNIVSVLENLCQQIVFGKGYF